MLNNLNKLELTNKDLELIESALSTQKKILSVQSEAGGTGARQKLSELRNLMSRIGRTRPERKPTAATSFMQMVRNLLSANSQCSQTR